MIRKLPAGLEFQGQPICPAKVMRALGARATYDNYPTSEELVAEDGEDMVCVGEPFCSSPQESRSQFLFIPLGPTTVECPLDELVSSTFRNPDLEE